MVAEAGGAGQKLEQYFQNFAVLKSNGKRPAVLVLGGSKFMGKALVEQLLSHEYRVCTVNRGREHWGTDDPSAGKTARVFADRREVDVFAQRIQEATKRLGSAWDMVVDFSAFDGADVTASLKGLRSDFKLYVYISSDSIYEVSSWAAGKWKATPGFEGDLRVSENAGVRPSDSKQQEALNKKDSYGHEKLQGEEALVKGLPHGCRAISLRLPDVIGPYDKTLRLWAYWHWLRAGEIGAPPPQVLSYKQSAKRARTESGAHAIEVPPNPQLAVVYSQDVARFIVSLLKHPVPEDVPACDAVNLSCSEQVPLSDLLGRLSAVSAPACKRPRLAPSKNPKTYLPSVDRPWPLSLERLSKVYGFEPTPLDDVLKSCAKFFQEACVSFPHEARRAAKKLPADSADMALRSAGLCDLPPSDDSS